MKSNTQLYFAYGSNLNIAQMRKRCPGAKPFSPAVLHGWKLVERLYADIEEDEKSCVNGALFSITEEDLAELDYYEGYPDFYTRLEVMVTDNCGIYRSAIVYTMTDECKLERSLQPYPASYRAICSQGAAAWGIIDAFAEKSSDKHTLFPDDISSVESALAEIVRYIQSGSVLPRAEQLWCGARVLITLKAQNVKPDLGFYPDYLEVTTPYAAELSWLFFDLKKVFEKANLLNSCNRQGFYQELAEQAAQVVKSDPAADEHTLCLSVAQYAEKIYKLWSVK